MQLEILVNDINQQITTYRQAIDYAGQALLTNNFIKPSFIQACIEREKLYPTGLQFENGKGIAIPHSSSDLVNVSSISILRLANEVEFGRMDDATLTVPCRLVFNLALSSGDQHILILRKLMKLLQQKEFIENYFQLERVEAVNYISEQLKG